MFKRALLCIIPRRYSSTLTSKIQNIPLDRYRNFTITAHVDHGKSTLSDRILELTNVIGKDSQSQILDTLEVERERGITIKAQTCTMLYNDKRDGKDYLLHLVDTPGHIDFRGEVVRSYASCGGALLLVDATQGVQAQTMTNFKQANDLGLNILPVVNKVDLETADVPSTISQMEKFFDIKKEDVVCVSAKTGINVDALFPQIIDKIPPPKGNLKDKFRALIVDSWYDTFHGVVLLVYIVDGSINKNAKIISAQTNKKYDVKDIGIMHPGRTSTGILSAGQIGYIICGMKDSRDAKNGDTLFKNGELNTSRIMPGFEEPKAMVFVGAFPSEGVDFKQLQHDIEKLALNDRSVSMKRITSAALGQGWRLGFLGRLHASVFCERLSKEYGTEILLTPATVPYILIHKDGKIQRITSSEEFPSLMERKNKIKEIQEPYVLATISVPQKYVRFVIQLCEENIGKRRGIIRKSMHFLNDKQNDEDSIMIFEYEMPLQVLVDSFFDKLKSATQGFADLNYENIGYKKTDVVKLDLLLNGEPIDAIAQIFHHCEAKQKGYEWVTKFKKFVRTQLFEVVIQARIDDKQIVARETMRARGKDVLAKLHASDITRRKKLLANQKKGKKAMKETGRVHFGKDVYGAFLRNND